MADIFQSIAPRPAPVRTEGFVARPARPERVVGEV